MKLITGKTGGKIAVGLCLSVFTGMSYALSVSSRFSVCENIWTAKCDDCPAPLLMECGGGEFKGHIKSSAVIKALRVYFYVSGASGAEVRTVEVEGFQMYPSYKEEEHVKALADKMSLAWPDDRIVASKAVYILDFQETPLYRDPEAKELAFTLGIVEYENSPLAVNCKKGDSCFEESKMEKSGDDVSDSRQTAWKKPAVSYDENLYEGLSEKEKKIAKEKDYVRKNSTGNEKSLCWPAFNSKPVVVRFTGDDQEICIMWAICLNISGREDTVTNLPLFCKFDSSKRICPAATQCLRDEDVVGRFDRDFYDSVYGEMLPLGEKRIPLPRPPTTSVDESE